MAIENDDIVTIRIDQSLCMRAVRVKFSLQAFKLMEKKYFDGEVINSISFEKFLKDKDINNFLPEDLFISHIVIDVASNGVILYMNSKEFDVLKEFEETPLRDLCFEKEEDGSFFIKSFD